MLCRILCRQVYIQVRAGWWWDCWLRVRACTEGRPRRGCDGASPGQAIGIRERETLWPERLVWAGGGGGGGGAPRPLDALGLGGVNPALRVCCGAGGVGRSRTVFSGRAAQGRVYRTGATAEISRPNQVRYSLIAASSRLQ